MKKLLLKLAGEKYKSPQSRLVPNIDPKIIIGGKEPLLRNLAKFTTTFTKA